MLQASNTRTLIFEHSICVFTSTVTTSRATAAPAICMMLGGIGLGIGDACSATVVSITRCVCYSHAYPSPRGSGYRVAFSHAVIRVDACRPQHLPTHRHVTCAQCLPHSSLWGIEDGPTTGKRRASFWTQVEPKEEDTGPRITPSARREAGWR